MATCKLPPKEFIRNSFLPQVAVVCSQAATETCQKNNLSFTELLQPFCKLGTEGTSPLKAKPCHLTPFTCSSIQRCFWDCDIIEEPESISSGC